MPLWQGFLGPSYTSRSRTVSADQTRNLYPEQVESGTGKDRIALYGRPGLSNFSNIAGGPGQGLIEAAGHSYAVAGGSVYEVLVDGTFQKIGSVGTSDPVSMAANNSQVIIVSAAGGGWIIPIGNNAGYAQITSAGFPPDCDSVTYQDTYFIATRGGTQEFFISAPDDGTSWDPLDFASKEGFGDNIVAVQSVRRQLWVMGEVTNEVWWNSGNANFPFQPIQGALLQVGCNAVRSPLIVGNGLFWIGKSNRGKAVAFAEQNFAPIRVSNHGVEAEWNRYATVSDAIGYGYEEDGHTFAVWSFPSAQATWVLDTRSGFWHEWDYWNTTLGVSQAALARFHCFCFNKHLVLDYTTGNVYNQSLNIYTDNGNVIRRVRRSPHVDQDKHNLTHVRFEMDIEVGTEPLGITPLYSLRYSDDGGRTWGNELIRPLPLTGKYKQQVIWRQLGSARDRVYELMSTSPVAHSWAAAYLRTNPSTELQ